MSWIWDRGKRFNETTGAFGYMSVHGPRGGHQHPDRCWCQGDDPTPHKHYDGAPNMCARCSECRGYAPAIPELTHRWEGDGTDDFDTIRGLILIEPDQLIALLLHGEHMRAKLETL